MKYYQGEGETYFKETEEGMFLLKNWQWVPTTDFEHPTQLTIANDKQLFDYLKIRPDAYPEFPEWKEECLRKFKELGNTFPNSEKKVKKLPKAKLEQAKRNRERVTSDEAYFTNDEVVDLCLEQLKSIVKPSDKIVEPSAGDGAFLNGFKRHSWQNKVIAYDIQPRREDIFQQDFLTVELIGTDYIAITNPPFGRANSLSIKFFNYLAPSCKYIAFLIPKSWRKWSIQNKLDSNFHLLSDIELPLNAFHTPDGKPYNSGVLKTVFQVWERRDYLREKVIPEDRGYFTKVSPSEATVAFTAFGYGIGKVETTFDRTKGNTCKLFLKTKDDTVIKALQEIDVKKFTQNVAYTEVISMEELRYLLNEYFDSRD